jgi:ParB family transcriptional regulator, chromosome partitioning protein
VSKERRLGRGLEALLGRTLEPAVQAADGGWQAGDGTPAAIASSSGGLLQLSVYEIDGNPFQPRRDFDETEIQALADSIRDHGLLQPIVVRVVAGRHQLIAGERRLRAAIKAGCAQVPVHIVQADDRQAAELAIIENLQRRDLNALEKAASFQQYLQRYHCTQEELAGRLNIDRSTVANLIRLLELPEAVQDAVRSGAITQGHARALLPLGDDAEQVAFCRRIQSEGLSVRATEDQVQELIHQADDEPLVVVTEEGETRRPARRGSHLATLEQAFRSALGTKVDVRQGGKGRGKIVIHFSSHEEFERLQEMLCGQPAGERRKAI